MPGNPATVATAATAVSKGVDPRSGLVRPGHDVSAVEQAAGSEARGELGSNPAELVARVGQHTSKHAKTAHPISAAEFMRSREPEGRPTARRSPGRRSKLDPLKEGLLALNEAGYSREQMALFATLNGIAAVNQEVTRWLRKHRR